MQIRWIFLLSILWWLAPVHAQKNLTQLGHLPYNNFLSDVWGWADGNGNEYALVGVIDGFSIVDVTDPSQPAEVAFIPGNTTDWRDIFSYNNHAYVVNEGGGGLLIVDLSSLPSDPNVTHSTFEGDSFTLKTAHNIFIDENGICFIFGQNGNGGMIILDVTTDPMQPIELARFSDFYIHDGTVRNDTLWGFAIDDGDAFIMDVSDKNNLELLAKWQTPGGTAHNGWMSDDGDYLFTTDEISNGQITSYDVSDVTNPTRIDAYQSIPGSKAIPHNTHYKDGFLITSYYRNGLTIVDASRPGNLVETGFYDTAPTLNGNGFNGCWGAYPYLPSGNVLATDIEEGLFILSPTYQNGCYLEGLVTDSLTGNPVIRPRIKIINGNAEKRGELNGEYTIGTADAGSYSVLYHATNYEPKTIENVQLVNGQLTLQDVELVPWPVGIEKVTKSVELQVFPNPVGELVTVRTSKPLGDEYTVAIYNVIGEVVYSQAWPDNSSEISFQPTLDAGIYILELSSGNQILTTQRLVKR